MYVVRFIGAADNAKAFENAASARQYARNELERNESDYAEIFQTEAARPQEAVELVKVGKAVLIETVHPKLTDHDIRRHRAATVRRWKQEESQRSYEYLIKHGLINPEHEK